MSASSSKSKRESVVLPHALGLPVMKKLKNKRVILASASPRRKDILARIGLAPEIIPSNFAENLPQSGFAGRLAEYPVATAGEKAIDVYERLVKENDHDPPDLVISGDTVVIFPPEADTADGGIAHGEVSEILEKPANADEQRSWLNMMNGRRVQIVTGVVLAYPCVEAPGYKLESISSSTIATFNDNKASFIDAYVESGEGMDKAGGFGLQVQSHIQNLANNQGLAGVLIEQVEGDYDNCAGFPSSAFWKWMGDLDEAGVLDEAWSA